MTPEFRKSAVARKTESANSARPANANRTLSASEAKRDRIRGSISGINSSGTSKMLSECDRARAIPAACGA